MPGQSGAGTCALAHTFNPSSAVKKDEEEPHSLVAIRFVRGLLKKMLKTTRDMCYKFG